MELWKIVFNIGSQIVVNFPSLVVAFTLEKILKTWVSVSSTSNIFKTSNVIISDLNVNPFDKTKSDNINRMIAITGDFYLVVFSKWDKWNVITLSG